MDDEQGPWWTRPPEPGPQARTGEQWRDHPYTEALDDDLTEVGADPHASADPADPSEPASDLPADQPGPEPEPEPAPPPAPRPSAIRRVAVVSPPPAPRTGDPGYGRGYGEYGDGGPTETLPAVGGDDIFAVFGGPETGPPGPGGRFGADPHGRADDPLAHLREDGEHHRRLPPLPHVAAGRLPLILAVGGLVGIVVLLVILIGPLSNNTQPGSATAARTASGTPGRNTPVATLTGKPPSGLTTVSSAQAALLLRKAGQHSGGTIVQAWSWTDNNGQNLVVDSIEPKNGKQDLRVTQVAQLNRDKPQVLRIMRDPGLPAGCKTGGSAGFTPGGTSVRDLNGDGVAEVAVGWSSRCGGASARSEVKLALITNGKKYIIRGKGVIGAKSGSLAPDPRASSWPRTYLAQLTTIFHKLYY